MPCSSHGIILKTIPQKSLDFYKNLDLNTSMSPLFQITVGLLAAVTGGAAVAFYFIADQVRHDPENFKSHRKASFVLGLCSVFFFALLVQS